MIKVFFFFVCRSQDRLVMRFVCVYICVCGKELTVLLNVVNANRCVRVRTGKPLFMLLFDTFLSECECFYFSVSPCFLCFV